MYFSSLSFKKYFISLCIFSVLLLLIGCSDDRTDEATNPYKIKATTIFESVLDKDGEDPTGENKYFNLGPDYVKLEADSSGVLKFTLTDPNPEDPCASVDTVETVYEDMDLDGTPDNKTVGGDPEEILDDDVWKYQTTLASVIDEDEYDPSGYEIVVKRTEPADPNEVRAGYVDDEVEEGETVPSSGYFSIPSNTNGYDLLKVKDTGDGLEFILADDSDEDSTTIEDSDGDGYSDHPAHQTTYEDVLEQMVSTTGDVYFLDWDIGTPYDPPNISEVISQYADENGEHKPVAVPSGIDEEGNLESYASWVSSYPKNDRLDVTDYIEGFDEVISYAVLTDEYGDVTACWIKGFHENNKDVFHLVDHNMDGDVSDPEDTRIISHIDEMYWEEMTPSEADSAWSNPTSTGYADQVVEYINN